MAGLSRPFPYRIPVPHRSPATPAGKPAGLGCSAFARRYLRNHCCCLFLRVLRCFTSPGVALGGYGFTPRALALLPVGCPIRRPTDQSVLAAPRGFSQLAASFVALRCQGIRRMPVSACPEIACTPKVRAFRPGARCGIHLVLSAVKDRKGGQVEGHCLKLADFPIGQLANRRIGESVDRHPRSRMVGVTGVGPVTSSLSGTRSNQLSYTPREVVEATGLEPAASSLQSWRSTN